jgi:hypothetical protein
MLEFLFCPVHGLLRPDNFQALLIMGNNAVVEIGFYLRKAGIL